MVKTTVLLQSIGDFAAMNAVYAEFFTSEMAARMCYQVAALPMGALVDIAAVAVKYSRLRTEGALRVSGACLLLFCRSFVKKFGSPCWRVIRTCR